MSLAKFRDDPWRLSHAAYETSSFNIRPAPEFATGEVVLASLFRVIGMRVAEGDVPKNGREFDRDALSQAKHNKLGNATGVSLDTWRTVLHGILESPKQPNQSSKRFLQLSPVVPDIAIYSGSARLSGNSWRPGALVQRMILLGSDSATDARRIWKKAFEAFSLTDADDIWARWLAQEFAARQHGIKWELTEFELSGDFAEADKERLRFPARQFVRDFEAILDSKESMTRRQWMTLLEAILRLGSVAHMLWLCESNRRLWKVVETALAGGAVTADAVPRAFDQEASLLMHGNPAAAHVRELASSYLVARLGMNTTLWALEEEGASPGKLHSLAELQAFVGSVSRLAPRISQVVRDTVGLLREEHARTVSCKKGIGSNLTEFARHVLGQRQTANETQRGYDQGYFLKKRGEHSSAPWVVSLGPVAVLALVHCCLRGSAGPRSIQRLSQHLETYGVAVDRDDIAASELGRKLRMLGLVLDSPDAESGMLLVPPFESIRKADGGLQ
jgi:hypothetical protein